MRVRVRDLRETVEGMLEAIGRYFGYDFLRVLGRVPGSVWDPLGCVT